MNTKKKRYMHFNLLTDQWESIQESEIVPGVILLIMDGNWRICHQGGESIFYCERTIANEDGLTKQYKPLSSVIEHLHPSIQERIMGNKRKIYI